MLAETRPRSRSKHHILIWTAGICAGIEVTLCSVRFCLLILFLLFCIHLLILLYVSPFNVSLVNSIEIVLIFVGCELRKTGIKARFSPKTFKIKKKIKKKKTGWRQSKSKLYSRDVGNGMLHILAEWNKLAKAKPCRVCYHAYKKYLWHAGCPHECFFSFLLAC